MATRSDSAGAWFDYEPRGLTGKRPRGNMPKLGKPKGIDAYDDDPGLTDWAKAVTAGKGRDRGRQLAMTALLYRAGSGR